MKKIYFLSSFVLLFCAFSFCAHSQDLIVNKSKEALNCRITKVDSRFIYFVDKNNVEQSLSRDSVDYYTYNHFSSSEPEIGKKQRKFDRFRLAADIGVGYRIGDTYNQFYYNQKSYTNDMRPGIAWGLDGRFYLNKVLGIGVRTSLFHNWSSFNVEQNMDYDPYYYYSYYSGNVDQTSTIFYLGPQIALRIPITDNNSQSFGINFSVGYQQITQNYWGNNSEFLLGVWGFSFGGVFEIGYDIKLTQKLGLGLAANITSGPIFYYAIEDDHGYEESYFFDDYNSPGSLFRVGVTIGLRFWPK